MTFYKDYQSQYGDTALANIKSMEKIQAVASGTRNVTKELNEAYLANRLSEEDFIRALQQGTGGAGPVFNPALPSQTNVPHDYTLALTPSAPSIPSQGLGVTAGTTGGFPTASLQPGIQGEDVRKLQDYLVSSGYMTPEQVQTGYGIYGPQTTAAVKKLQETLGVDYATGPGFFGPKTISALQNKYTQGFAQATQKGGEAPKTSSGAAAKVAGYIAPTPTVSAADQLMQQDAGLKQIWNDYQDFFSPKTQRTSLVDEYKNLLQASGLEAIDTELLNTKRIIEGTEDDIREEITKAAGFATDSQVLALTGARNKQLIKNYNNLLETRNSKAKYLDTLMTLTAEDRKSADAQFDRMMNFQFKVSELGMQMQKNAQDMFGKIVDKVGYNGLYQSILKNGDSSTMRRIEEVIGLPSGGLLTLAMQPNLDEQVKELQILKLKKEIEAMGNIDNADLLLAYAQQYAATGQIPTGLPKGTFGQVAGLAKQFPQLEGAIVDSRTGIKSSAVSDTLQGGYGAMYSAINLAKQLVEIDKERRSGIIAGTVGKVFGSETQQAYIDLRIQIIDLLARARTGATLTREEEKIYGGMLPGRFDEPLFLGADSQVRINNFINNLSADLSNKIATQGLVMYGFSNVKIGDKRYKVGDIIKNESGQKGRVNTDGTITVLQ